MARNLDKPHLLFLVTEDWYFVSHRLSIAKAALNAGFRVTVVTQVNRCREAIEAAGIELVHLPGRRGGLNVQQQLQYWARVHRIYRRLRPDIVHHVGMKPVIYGSISARLAGIRNIVNALGGLGFVFTSNALKARLVRPFVKQLLRIALGGEHSLLILQNQDDQQMLVRRGFIDEARIRLIRGVGIDVARYPAPAQPTHECLVILPARLLRDKGVVEFADAARQLKAEGLTARFALVGAPDPENPASLLQDEVDAWVREGVVESWGWRDDMVKVVSQADLVCLPSYREGLPKALLEACAAGKAIVTTDTPGCREVVQEGVNGMLVPARDTRSLAGALRALIEDPQRRYDLGRNGRELAQQNFSERSVLAASLAVYRELLK